ncbi:hypothetical protein EF660_08725 [Salmonella enterica subsp. enterica serovar Infantis]|nr:hypothetical protein [Salmonella enterica subsp. enterica serovar Infantis]
MVEIQMTYTSMGVRVEVPIRQAERAILAWAEENMHAPKMGKQHGRITTERGDAYYAHIPSLRTFIFHKVFAEKIKHILQRAAIEYAFQYKLTEHHPVRGTPYKCTFDNYGFKMEETDPESRFYYQNEVVAAATDPSRSQTVFAIQTGRGKALAHGTRVRVPGGWKNIEDIQLGDYVTGRDGKPAMVSGVFPQGVVDLYQVTFWDGRSVDVCGEHLWQSYYVNTTENRRWGVRDTLEMKRLISMPNPRVYIPLPEPEEMPAKDFVIHPYLLGILLGDGSLSMPGVLYTKGDVEIRDRVAEVMPAGHAIHDSSYSDGITKCISCPGGVNLVRRELERLGLIGCRSWEKFIPGDYFETSIEQRWELLRGLMDTDGTVDKDGGTPSFCSTSKELALGVQELVRSLGGIATLREKRPFFTHNGERREGRLAYNVSIRHKTPSKLFHLPRKKELCRDNGQYTDILKLRVKSIEPIGRDLATCIRVENDDALFVVDKWIVTHNTKTCMKSMVKRGTRTALIHRPSYVPKWLFDVCDDETGLRILRDEVLVCTGVQAIYDALEMGKSGELDSRGIKVIILPTVSLQRFLKEYINTAATNPVDLDTFYDVLGVGLVAMDEVHEHFHLVYMAGIMLNPPASIEMSATLKPGSSKAFIAERYLERFPMEYRISIPIIPVVDVKALYYRLDDKKFAWWASKMTPYNHKLFEGKLIKENLHLEYANMIWDVVEKSFLKRYQPGQKCLILFATVAMCEFFTEYVKDKLSRDPVFHPLMVAKYNAGDSYDDFIQADFSISTPGKAGTAVDKPGLVHMYISTPVEDQQLNEQMAGRPRKILHNEWGEIDPTVWLFHAYNVPKHCNYLNARQKSLKDVVLSFRIATSPYVVRKSHAHSAASSRAAATLHRNDFSKFSRKHSKGVSRRRRRR